MRPRFGPSSERECHWQAVCLFAASFWTVRGWKRMPIGFPKRRARPLLRAAPSLANPSFGRRPKGAPKAPRRRPKLLDTGERAGRCALADF